jgi:hypothetical protein
LINDVNVNHRKCIFEGCGTGASFGDPNDKIPQRCSKHKLESDENVVNKRCEYQGCQTFPSFGNLNDGIHLRCFQHKLETDENVICKRCEYEDCRTVPSFGSPDDHKRKRCMKHKLITDVDVTHKKRIKCNTHRIYFNDICSICDPTSNQRKEYKVVNFLKSRINEKLHNFVHNRILPNNDNIKYKPDILYRFSDSAIIVEIDEFQHNSYDPIMEEERMRILREILGCNVLFIRFNQINITSVMCSRRLNWKRNWIDCLRQFRVI